MKTNKIVHLGIPPESRHIGVGLFSTDDRIVNFLLPEVQKAIPSAYSKYVKFSPSSNFVGGVVHGKFEMLASRDTAVGLFIVKLLSEDGWEIVSSSVDNDFTYFTFKKEENV